MQFPIRLNLFVHADGRGFIDRHDHRFAPEAPPDKMQDDILRHFFEPVFTGDQMIFPRELALQAFLLGFIDLCLFEQVLHIV